LKIVEKRLFYVWVSPSSNLVFYVSNNASAFDPFKFVIDCLRSENNLASKILKAINLPCLAGWNVALLYF
jgi:hypothetical protein